VGTSAQFLLTMGGILLLGLFISALAQRTFLPRVTLLLIFGMIIGNEFLNLIPDIFSERFDMIADMTLLMVGFLLGGKLTLPSLKDQAGEVFWISLTAAVITTVIVSLGLYLIGVSLEISILLGCIASATAPAAILDVTEESGINNRFSNLLVSVVALDDIWALVLFAIGLAVVGTLNGTLIETSFIMILSKEIGGAVLLGTLIGVPAAYLTGRIKPGQPILTEALGIVFVCGGLALWLDVSYLIASIIMGAVIANLAKHHDYPFHAIEGIEKPLMVIFFTLAGASLEISVLKEIGLMGIAYIFCRILGKYIGARIGCQISRTTGLTRRWIGVALLPQAGVSIGMALVASSHFPEYRQLLLSLVIGSTVFFEIIGPVFTNMALQRTYKQ
jgi:Kef-type K+ transport system membrane component KefB